MDGKAILNAIIALILYIIFAMIYFIILAFIIYYGTKLAAGHYPDPGSVATAAAILAAGTIIAGGGLADAFRKELT